MRERMRTGTGLDVGKGTDENGNGHQERRAERISGTDGRERNEGKQRERERRVGNGTRLPERERNGLHGAGVIMGGWSGGVRVRMGAWVDGGSDGPGVKLFVKLLFCE